MALIVSLGKIPLGLPRHQVAAEKPGSGARTPCRISFTCITASSTNIAVGAKAHLGRRERQRQLLEELKVVAEQLGIRVREERLLREVGYRVHSGACRVRETDLVLLDRGLPVESQIEVLVNALAPRALEKVYLSPAARRLFDDRREKRAGAPG